MKKFQKTLKKQPHITTLICEICNSSFSRPFKKRKVRHCSSKCAKLNPKYRDKISKARVLAINRGITSSYGTKSEYQFNGNSISCDSNIERACLNYFESLGATSMNRSNLIIPYVHNGINRRFLPDFIIVLDGKTIIVEAKSYSVNNFLNGKWNDYVEKSILKKIALDEYCKVSGLEAFWFTPKLHQKYYSSIIRNNKI